MNNGEAEKESMVFVLPKILQFSLSWNVMCRYITSEHQQAGRQQEYAYQ
jgi:hypothetical protein